MPAEASSLSDVRWQAVGVGWLDNGSRNMDDDGGLSWSEHIQGVSFSQRIMDGEGKQSEWVEEGDRCS